MPPRIASGAPGDRGRLKAQILARPASVEDGLRALDADLPAGSAGTIDLVLLDRDGALVLLAIATDDPDATLLRLLDQLVWAAEQRGVLLRLYGTAGLRSGAPLRGLLLAPGFSPPFLSRLSLVAARIEAYLARPLPDNDDTEALIEPAAAIFGARGGAEPAVADPGRAPATEAAPGEGEPGAREPRVREPRVRETRDREPRDRESRDRERRPAAEVGLPEEPAEAGILDPFDDLPLPPAEIGPDPTARADDPFEPLTAEELEAFEVFERQRRIRERRSS